jgi:hypothetical protein
VVDATISVTSVTIWISLTLVHSDKVKGTELQRNFIILAKLQYMATRSEPRSISYHFLKNNCASFLLRRIHNDLCAR